MASVNYITPITNRTQADVDYAKTHQNDLVNKNKGAWNYTDLNRICNNLKYAAEYMYEQGFLLTPYSLQMKLDWKETDIVTYEILNTMIVQVMNDLKTYSRPDLQWYPVISITNMDYSLANWLERNIHALATQVPIPPDKYKLTVKKGTGSGEYEANTVVEIQADPAEEGYIFSHWSGNHLENIEKPNAAITKYKMPYSDIILEANYTSAIPHTLTVETYTKTYSTDLSMGAIHFIEADPAPQGKVFHHWEVEPNTHVDNLYEPAASTHFTMPNEAVKLTAVYITKGEKQLKVINGNGSGYYEYDTYAAISSSKPANTVFTKWTGDTQYLTSPATQEYNSVKIPDVNVITVRANWALIPATNIKLTVVNGTIASTGKTEGTFTQGDRVAIIANPTPEGQVFSTWTGTGDGTISNANLTNAIVTIGASDITAVATYRTLEYHTLKVITHSGTTTTIKEAYEYFSVNADPAPDGQTFDKWTGDTNTFNQYAWQGFDINEPQTGTYMGESDRTITANYRPINTHTLTVKQLSGDVTYEKEEFTKISITAEDAPAGQRFVRWNKSGEGEISSKTEQSITFTFGNGDTTLTPIYVNVWTITVVDGTIDGKATALLDEGETYTIRARNLAIYEGFNGWTQNGPGTINNIATPSSKFVVGNGDTILTANIIEYPDKTLTVYWRHPDTEVDTLISQKTYTYGTKIENIEAAIAPNKSTFSSWLGDVNLLSPSALASTVTINSLTADTTIVATYYYPEAPEYYTLTVYDGYPESGEYETGSQITIRAREPNEGWEFAEWYGDIQYLVNPDITLEENSVIMPKQAITLRAKFNMIGDLPLYRVSVTEGIAKGTYYTGEEPEEGEEDERIRHDEEGVYIDVPVGTEVTLTANPDTVGYTFDRWEGNFDQAGVDDIIKTNNPTVFTMVRADVNVEMKRRKLKTCSVYTTDADGPGADVPAEGNKYPIKGNLQDTEDYHYDFEYWTCVDADDNDCISAIRDPDLEETEITLTDKDLWIRAVYTISYRLTVIKGQDSGDGYYRENETVESIYADAPEPESRTQFDHWDDPMGIVKNIYDKTPTIIMKDTVAVITAVFTSIDATGNSVVITGDDIHDELITRTDSYLINGVYTIGAIVFDKDGCAGVITKVDPDGTDDTDDFQVEKLFYGGNV